MTNYQHIEYGRHSNIPECCIAFFIGPWDEIRQTMTAQEWDCIGPNYVRCSECIKHNRRANLHNCTTDCIPFHRFIEHWSMLRILLRQFNKEIIIH